MFYISYIILLFVLLINAKCEKQSQRALIFPPTTPTRAQIIYGIGVPLNLDTESLTTGYVLKAEYFLPTKASELRPLQLSPQLIHKRSLLFNETNDELRKLNKKLSRYRWAVYKAIETIMDRAGISGRACMLRSLCEAAEIPFHYHSGLLGEFLHILMSPSSSVDLIEFHSDNQYYHAEVLGKSGAPCGMMFNECKGSLLNKISNVYKWSSKFFKYL